MLGDKQDFSRLHFYGIFALRHNAAAAEYDGDVVGGTGQRGVVRAAFPAVREFVQGGVVDFRCPRIAA